ncbi:gastrula zinc finger protein XlCGF57.1-like [Sphaeramia orbicularis]|uniref:Gastrula zinc finger protein XlCGF57.1-like n=1 Tax=Sphaeramia orbicularis TaxID=375764 RepID=A0A672ZFT6_9TELE|nr:gastrula zinc finger protein XlCGF57.1-like [Sphaeramia orbicularis]
MSQNVQILRSLVEQRLTAAAEEIFGLFERTIAEYEEELCRTKEENQRQRQILDEVWNEKVLMKETDVHQLSEVKEEAPHEQQELSPSLDQENPEPHHVIEEQEELLTSLEADIAKFPSSCVLVKSEDDEVEVQSSQLHHKRTEGTVNGEETDAVDYGGSESTSCFHPHGDLHTQTEDPEDTDNNDGDWTETGESDSMPNTYNETIVMDGKFNGKKCFFCSLCGKKFANKTNVKRHVLKYHTTRQILSCPFCGKTFGEKENLKSHIAVHTGEKRYRSCVGDKSWRLQVKSHKCIVESLQYHQSESVEKKELLANGSTERMGTEDGGSQAAIDQVQTEDLECRAAQNSFWKSRRRFHSKGFLETTMGSHKEERPFVCQFCGIKYKRYSSLSCHLNIHRGETQFHCHLCDQRFTRWSKWRIHKCILCKACNRRFTCLSLFKRHKCGLGSGGENSGHTNTESTVGDCGGAEPTRSSDSDQYQQPEGETEHGSKSGVNSVWKKNSQKSGLKSQMKSKVSATDSSSKTNEKSHACSECGKRFWTRALLLIHMRVHTGEKPFCCSECGKRFSQKANLLRHMMSHTGEKPFSCSVCTERFTQKNSLKKHMNIHRREKQFVIGYGQESTFQKIHQSSPL